MLVAAGAIGYAPELDQRLPYDPELPKGCWPTPAMRKASAVTLDCPNNSNIVNDEAICRAIAHNSHEVGIAVTANPQPNGRSAGAKFDNRESNIWSDGWSTINSELIFKYHYQIGRSGRKCRWIQPRPRWTS